MVYVPLTVARRHVLGDLYAKCDSIENVPVYLGSETGERIGFVEQAPGGYSDAFTFHLGEAMCKKLSTGHYVYSFGYDYAEAPAPGSPRRIKLNFICLSARSPIENRVKA